MKDQLEAEIKALEDRYIQAEADGDTKLMDSLKEQIGLLNDQLQALIGEQDPEEGDEGEGEEGEDDGGVLLTPSVMIF